MRITKEQREMMSKVREELHSPENMDRIGKSIAEAYEKFRKERRESRMSHEQMTTPFNL